MEAMEQFSVEIKRFCQLLEKGDNSFSKGNFTETNNYLGQALQQISEAIVPFIRLERPSTFEQQKDYVSAIEELERVIHERLSCLSRHVSIISTARQPSQSILNHRTCYQCSFTERWPILTTTCTRKRLLHRDKQQKEYKIAEQVVIQTIWRHLQPVGYTRSDVMSNSVSRLAVFFSEWHEMWSVIDFGCFSTMKTISERHRQLVTKLARRNTQNNVIPHGPNVFFYNLASLLCDYNIVGIKDFSK